MQLFAQAKILVILALCYTKKASHHPAIVWSWQLSYLLTQSISCWSDNVTNDHVWMKYMNCITFWAVFHKRMPILRSVTQNWDYYNVWISTLSRNIAKDGKQSQFSTWKTYNWWPVRWTGEDRQNPWQWLVFGKCTYKWASFKTKTIVWALLTQISHLLK